MIKIKRIYEKQSKEDGYRILVDRLWAKGLTKQKAVVDLWPKEIAPSNELRKYYSHDPAKWNDFFKKYKKELKGKDALLNPIKVLEKQIKIVIPLFSSKEEKLNNALKLKKILEAIP